MKYLAILGRQPEISLAELEALFDEVKLISDNLATFESEDVPQMARIGGSLKIAEELVKAPIEFLKNLPDGKITFGISDYSKNASHRSVTSEALKLKKILTRHSRSVRVVTGDESTLSTATSLHNGLGGTKSNKIEFIVVDKKWWKVIGVQDIDAYARRDQARPARDAKVGMLPPKLAQILINLCGRLPEGARILDPFCGTGVVLQEALLMGYSAYGTDLSERMIEYTKKNLTWLSGSKSSSFLAHFGGCYRELAPETREDGLEGRGDKNDAILLSVGDATNFTWEQPIDAVACEGYLGSPMSLPPAEIKLKAEKQNCSTIILGFLKNLGTQIKSGTPVVMAIPAWLRPDNTYSRLKIVDEIQKLGYNVYNKSGDGLLYYRDGQVVAREIIILRKK